MVVESDSSSNTACDSSPNTQQQQKGCGFKEAHAVKRGRAPDNCLGREREGEGEGEGCIERPAKRAYTPSTLTERDTTPRCYSTLTYPTGDVYTGYNMDQKPDGYGYMVFVNGDTYKGEWKEGVRWGAGTSTTSEGVYTGTWVNDSESGTGVCVYSDGACYEGEWVEGERSGHGIYDAADGSTYVGEWCKDK
ncbi:hypothetical protein KIPB_013729, partial [Kipferlia bialata]|eukprot:g13729.t1